MLGWFVDDDVITRVLSNDCLIDETEVEVRLEKIPRKCLDENVCISQIKKFFTFNAWSLVAEVVETMCKKGVWTCKSCSLDLCAHESIACDSCLDWHHLKYAGLSKPPKTKFWFCRSCHM